MSNTRYEIGLGAWVAIPILTFIVSAAAHAGWLFTGWVLR